jgi:hypothetical protein
MSEGKIRGKLLVELWAAGKPISIQVLSEKVGLTSSSAMGYLLGLIKAKYVSVPETHYYAITDAGKQAIGLPKIDKEQALKILASVPLENAFHFYYGINRPSGIVAYSLKDFVDKILAIDLISVTFHSSRTDFELWIRSLGDVELSKKLNMLRASNLVGEQFRKEIYEAVKSRHDELVKLSV